jgi:hypothetical protein
MPFFRLTDNANRWDRLSDINIGTHQYLSKTSVQRMIQEAAARIGKIELTKRRLEGQGRYGSNRGDTLGKGLPTPPSHPDAVELPGEDAPARSPVSPYHTPRSSTINPPYPYHDSQDKFVVHPSDDSQSRISAEMPYRYSGEYSSPNNISPRRSGEDYGRAEAPPIPPKTPIYGDGGGLRPPQSNRMSAVNPKLPYPDFDGPPVVNKLRKPQYNLG